MSKQNNLTDFLADVADAIRSKKGTTDLINPQNFSAEIAALSGGLEVIEMTETTATIEPNKVYVWGMVESLDITLGASTDVNDFFAFRFRCSKPTMTSVTVNGATWAADTELDESGKPILDLGSYYQCEIKGGTSALYARLAHYIPFVDSNVEAVLMSKGVGDGIGITYKDAAKVTTVSTWFQNNKDITAFDEFAAFSGITALVKYAFRDCSSLERIKLPSSITKFSGDAVFEYCTALTEIYLPSALTSLAAWTFNECTLLAKIYGLGDTQLTRIGEKTFNNCSALKEIAFPPSLTTIGGLAFQGCTSLVTASGLGETQLTSIGNGAFNGCSLLKEIAFPPTLTTMGQYAFLNCKALAKASGLGNTQVMEIKSEFFNGCSSLAEITLPASLTSIGDFAFRDCSALTEVAFPASLTSIGRYAFNNCKSLVTASGLGETQLTSIGNGAFNGCSLLKEIAFPPTLTTMGQYAFLNCKALAKASGLGNTQVMEIKSEFFNGCSSLAEITLPASLTSIGDFAFSGCSSLTEITLPAGVTSIGPSAFIDCTSLQYIRIEATTPPTLVSTNAIPSTIGAIYVPDESVEAYKAATNWSSFASKIKGISEMPAK